MSQILSKSPMLTASLLEKTNLFMMTQDMDFNVLSFNSKFKSLTRHSVNNFLELFPSNTLKKDFGYEVKKLINVPGRGRMYRHTMELNDGTGGLRVISWEHTLINNENGDPAILSVGMDVTYRKKVEDELNWLANNDTLTGIGNRRSFNHILHETLASTTCGALVFIDINKFKKINDIYGHPAGDKVLISVAKILKGNIRTTDFAFRLAGDEFTLILSRINRTNLLVFMKNLLAKISEQTIIVDGLEIAFSISAGCAIFPEHSKCAEDLITYADLAMYKAKKTGEQQCYIYEPSDNSLNSFKFENHISLKIKESLCSNRFKLHFQPIMSLCANTISHYEVLIRMQDNYSDALIMPDEFIPTAEKLGLIGDIDEWVLDHALSKLSMVSDQVGDLAFSINISAPTLQKLSFLAVITGYLQKYSIAPERIVIELTETAYIDNISHVMKNLNALSSIGVNVALDDFGVGFSSFNYLKQMPLKYVKLDGSYIVNLLDSQTDQVFVESLSRIINSCGMQTIAEFVENEGTVKMLRQFGVSYCQGFYIGEPKEDLVVA